jgi:hypothetical protein
MTVECSGLLDISLRAETPDKAVVYMDGRDARIFKQLLYKLGSEERVQNAMILTGLLSQTMEASTKLGKQQASEIKASFPDLVGMSFEDFNKILDAIKF